MTIRLPDLPYSLDALAPTISRLTLETHWGKHHRGYVATVNKLVPGTALEGATLEDILHRGSGPLLNAAAQAWNHSFLWKSMSPRPSTMSAALASAVEAQFGSLAALVKAIRDEALGVFGSGWTWLLKAPTGGLEIISTPNAGLRVHDERLHPLLVCDVWEHAYYLDYRNDRARYLDGFLELADWSFASERFALPHAGPR